MSSLYNIDYSCSTYLDYSEDGVDFLLCLGHLVCGHVERFYCAPPRTAGLIAHAEQGGRVEGTYSGQTATIRSFVLGSEMNP